MGQSHSEPASCDEGFIKVDGTCMTMDTLKSNFKLIEYSQWEEASENLNAEIQETGRLKGELTAEKQKTGRLEGELTAEKLETGKLEGELTAEKQVTGRLSGELTAEKLETGRLSGELTAEKQETERLSGELDTEKQETGRLSGELVIREETIQGLRDDLGEAKEHYAYTPDAKLCSYLHQRLQCEVNPTQCTMLHIDNRVLANGSEFHKGAAKNKEECGQACLDDMACIGASFDNSCYIIKKWGLGVHRDGTGTFMFKSCENINTAQLHADILGNCPSGEEMAEHHMHVATNRHRNPEKTDKQILTHHLLTNMLSHQNPVNGKVYHHFWNLPEHIGMWTNRMKVGTCADGYIATMVNNTKHPTISAGKRKNVQTPVTIQFDDNSDELPASGKRYRITDEISSLPMGSFIQMKSQREGELVDEHGKHIRLDQDLVAGTRFTLEPLKQSYSCADGPVECEIPIVGGVCGGDPTPEDCKKTCDAWPICQGFYYNNNKCMFYDSSCKDAKNCEEHHIYGDSATRISGYTDKRRYTTGHPVAIAKTQEECQTVCQRQPECSENQCRTLTVDSQLTDAQSNPIMACYCDVTNTTLTCDDSTYARYENKKAVKTGYNRTLPGPYASREEASKACDAVNLKLCERNLVRSTCEYGFTEDAPDPGMFIERITEERQKTTPVECDGKTREQCFEPKCAWGYDDQTGDYACRGGWWNLCGNESGMWHYNENAMGGAHCCN